MQNANIIIGRARFLSTSPRKLRLVADSVRQLPISRALIQLEAMPKRSAGILLKVMQQAVGNAKNNFKLSPEDLKIDSIMIDEGPRFKRRDVHAHGARFDSGMRRKRMSHIVVKLKTQKSNVKN